MQKPPCDLIRDRHCHHKSERAHRPECTKANQPTHTHTHARTHTHTSSIVNAVQRYRLCWQKREQDGLGWFYASKQSQDLMNAVGKVGRMQDFGKLVWL